MNKKFLFSFIFSFILVGCTFNKPGLQKEQIGDKIESSSIIGNSLTGDIKSSLQSGEEKVNDFPYRLILDTTKSYLPIERKGDATFNDMFNNQVYTNDPTWKIESLLVAQEKKDTRTYKCFYCEDGWEKINYYGEDNKNIFLYDDKIAISKQHLPGFFPLQHLGIQAMMGMVGYTKGYLVYFPFKFPVDIQTFRTVQIKEQLQWGKKEEIQSLSMLSDRGSRRPKFRNGGLQYDKYLGDDKNWVYFWSSDSFGEAINRIKKESDFRILKFDEILGITTKDDSIGLKLFTGEIGQDWGILHESFAGSPAFYYYDNAIYISRYKHGKRKFPVDGATIKGEEKQFQKILEDSSIYYSIISDKDWWYQLIYHMEGDYYELQRLKR